MDYFNYQQEINRRLGRPQSERKSDWLRARNREPFSVNYFDNPWILKRLGH